MGLCSHASRWTTAKPAYNPSKPCALYIVHALVKYGPPRELRCFQEGTIAREYQVRGLRRLTRGPLQCNRANSMFRLILTTHIGTSISADSLWPCHPSRLSEFSPAAGVGGMVRSRWDY